MIFIGLLLLILAIAIALVSHENDTKEKKYFFTSTHKFTEQRNCEHETVYSVITEQCIDICTDVFVSRNGVCVNSKIPEEEEVKNKCNSKAGVFAYLIGNTELGTADLFCISSDPGIQPNDSSIEKNKLCKNGEIEIDYTKSLPLLQNCKCGNNEFLALIAGTSTIRRHGLCLSIQTKPFFEANNLLFSS